MRTRLYRFYNFERDAQGDPFALCDEHLPQQVVPTSCILREIASRTIEACAICEDEALAKAAHEPDPDPPYYDHDLGRMAR